MNALSLLFLSVIFFCEVSLSASLSAFCLFPSSPPLSLVFFSLPFKWYSTHAFDARSAILTPVKEASN